MIKIDYRKIAYSLPLIVLLLDILSFQNETFDNIRKLTINAIFVIGFLLFYFNWKTRSLLISFFLILIFFNLKLLLNDLTGLQSLSYDLKFILEKIVFIVLSFGVVLLIIGVINRKFKYWSDFSEYPIKKLILISISITITFQLSVRLLIN